MCMGKPRWTGPPIKKGNENEKAGLPVPVTAKCIEKKPTRGRKELAVVVGAAVLYILYMKWMSGVW